MRCLLLGSSALGIQRGLWPLAPCLYYLTIRDHYEQDELGRVFELVVGAQLVRTQEELFYWREGSQEIDFVLKKGRLF